ncbi:MAG: leucyl aminopeptidase [Tissierellia bacterium]|nr:leucyl aminopeptidase [Tissierellia bacterium]
MKIKLEGSFDASVKFFFEDQLDSLEKNYYDYFEKTKVFSGKKDEIYCLVGPNEQEVFVGLGKADESTLQILRKQSYALGKSLKEHKISSAGIEVMDFKSKTNNRDFCALKAVDAIVEGLLQSAYRFDKYVEKTEDEEINIVLQVREGYEEKAKRSIEETSNLMEGVFLTRDLVNTPSNDMYPETLAKAATEKLSTVGVHVKIYGKKQIEEMGMEAFLSVARGSAKEPQFIVMEYLPVEGQQPMAIVGKGLTYDSGGYAIKPASGMVTMKCDMGGAASVIGTLYALGLNKVKKNVVGVVAACENMISGDAYKNGDIISSMKGSTIEILNTDAEGRVTLADSLYYAATKIDPEVIIDLATLTGAAIVAVGEQSTILISNDDEWANRVEKAGDDMGEYMVRLPMNEELREAVKGDVSTVKNSVSSGGGGSITAGIFLEHFVEKKPWVHMDIAGPAYSSSAYSYLPKYATGIPVKTLYKTIFDQSSSKIDMEEL